MKNIKKVTINSIISISILLSIFVIPAIAETASISNYNVAPGSTFTVPIQITSITTDIAAATVRLTFNPAVVTVQAVNTGDLGTKVENINYVSGTVDITAATTTPATTAPVTIANVVFKGVATAVAGSTSPLTLTVTTLSDSNGNIRTPVITSGSVTISGGGISGTVVTIQDAGGSSSISGASSSVVPVSIVAKNVQNLGAATITLSYDPGVVTVQSVSSGALGTPVSNINNIAGSTQITSFSLLGKSGNVTIANLELKVAGSTGANSPLMLSVSSFSDSSGNSISSTVSSGQLSVVPYLRGDMNCDNMVNIIDALLIAQYSVGLRSAPYTC